MYRERTTVFLAMAVLLASSATLFLVCVGKVSAQSRPALPDEIIYGRVFHRVALLDRRASEAQARGEDRSFLRQIVRTRAGLTEREGAVLQAVALQCESQAAEQDARAAAVIRRVKAGFPQGLIPRGATPPAPAAELADLQRERTNIILSARDKLRIALGEMSFASFDNYARAQAARDLQSIR